MHLTWHSNTQAPLGQPPFHPLPLYSYWDTVTTWHRCNPTSCWHHRHGCWHPHHGRHRLVNWCLSHSSEAWGQKATRTVLLENRRSESPDQSHWTRHIGWVLSTRANHKDMWMVYLITHSRTQQNSGGKRKPMKNVWTTRIYNSRIQTLLLQCSLGHHHPSWVSI